MAKFTREQAIAHVMEHDPDGRRLAHLSKLKNISQYGAKHAEYFGKLGADPNAPRPKPFKNFVADEAPSVRVDPRNREQLAAGQSAVDAGHDDGRDFHERI